jgi:hypothetical protein
MDETQRMTVLSETTTLYQYFDATRQEAVAHHFRHKSATASSS